MPSPSLLDLSREELIGFVEAHGEPRFRAQQIWQAVYRELVSPYGSITTLPVALREMLTTELPADPLRAIDAIESEDRNTRKVLFRLGDGEAVEAVLMKYIQRWTACLSTQVGCSVGCPFCATGKSGYVRNLSVGEIVGQALHFARELKQRGERLSNIVYMGMGEPFLNYDATLKSIRTLNNQEGFALGARAFTVSTVGIVPAIERFAKENLQANLAISLHAADDELRNDLVPINRRYPLAELIRACRAYAALTHRRVTFEVALIDGLNDSKTQAREMAALLSGMLCHVNVIPLNPIPESPFRSSSRKRTARFATELRQAGIPVTVRLGRGIEIQAGCGQLRSQSALRQDGRNHSLSRPR